MAGDWIKIEKATARKPEVLRLADILDIHPDHAFGLCIRFWFWCDDQLVDGHAPSVTSTTLNHVVGHSGFAEALREVGWLSGKGKRLSVPNFDRHLSESAKNRALSLERKRKQRESDVTVLSRDSRDESVTREEKSERESSSLKGDRKAIGSSTSVDRSSRALASPKDARDEGDPFDLDHVDWNHVFAMADRLAGKIPARTAKDRRAWIRYAVMADVMFDEHWLVDSVEAVLSAGETRTKRQAHFVGVLKSKAAERGTDSEAFDAVARRIKLPNHVWKAAIVEIIQ